MTGRRKILIFLSIFVPIVLLVTTVWKEQIRTAVRDVRYSPLLATPQTDSDAERFSRMHERILKRKSEGSIDVLFLGDSITEFWQLEDFKSIWDKRFAPLNAGNFGVSSDTTQNVLWRITEGKELDGLSPKLVVLMIGTNNTPTNSAGAIAGGIEQIVATVRTKLPMAKILLLSILPRERGGDETNQKIREINRRIASLDDRRTIRYLDLTPDFVDSTGRPSSELSLDGLHLNRKGYETLADTIEPEITSMLHLN